MKTLTTFLVASVSALALTASFAAAQDGEEPFELGTLVLRGELQDRPIEESPTSAVVVTGEELDVSGDLDLYDVIDQTPGVVAANNRQGFVIRGVDQRGATGGGTGLTISTQVDGVALPSNQATFFGPYSTWDLQQIEILRGPQSTQQGRNALAGAIIIRSQDPVFDEEYKLRAEVGERGFLRFAATANAELIEDKLALRFSADVLEGDGFVTNINTGADADPFDQETYRLKLRWKPVEQLDLNFSYTRAESFAGEDLVLEPPFPNDFVNSTTFSAREGAENDLFGIRAEYEFANGFVLTTETNYFRFDGTRIVDFDLSTAALGTFDADYEDRSFEQDIQLSFSAGIFEGVVGSFYNDIEETRDSILVSDAVAIPNLPFAAPAPGLFIGERINNFTEETENYAIFGEVDIDASGWTPGLSFTAGFRYDRETFEFRNIIDFNEVFDPFNLIDLNSIPGFEDSVQTGRTTFDAFLPKLGVTYEFDANQRLSFTYQRGYRAGGAQVNQFTGALNEFDAEFTDNFEIAFRGSYFEDRLGITANVFYTEWDDIQVSVLGPSGFPLDQNVVNGGEAELFGFEFGVDAQVSERTNLYFNGAYVDSEFTNFVSTAGDFTGNQLPQTAPITVSLGGSVELTDTLTWSVNASYTDEAFFFADNDVDTKSDDRWIVDTQLVFLNDAGLSAGLYVRNLFDEEYAAQRTDATASLTGVTSLVRAGEPRTVGFFVQREF